MTRFARLAAVLLTATALNGCGVPAAVGLAGAAVTPITKARATTAPVAPPAGNLQPGVTPAMVFDYMDADRSDTLTLAELMNGPFGQPAAGWKPGEKEASVQDALRTMDTNGDRLVQRAEFLAAWSAAGAGGQGQAPTSPTYRR
jgi:hypothetical protein